MVLGCILNMIKIKQYCAKKTNNKRILVFAIIILVLIIIWIELAVGIFNSPFAGS